MNARPLGRFTFEGSEAVEVRTGEVVREVARAIGDLVTPSELQALVLIGGYGRGEGGVELVDGVEAPHNNLDFLLLSRRGDPAALRRRIDSVVQRIARERGIGVDVGVVPVTTLRHATCRVMWYDMRHGHKTVLGDDTFVPSLTQFTVERILPADARDLMTNRGTLLVINGEILARGALPLSDRRLVVKHVVKAIIGYGDCLLYFLGDYHWSYAEKRARMQRRHDVDPDFRALYDQAIGFRFRPAYAEWLDRDLDAWTASVVQQLSTVHRAVEGRRLGRPIDGWDDYLERALAHVIVEDLSSARGLARKAKNLLQRGPRARALGVLARPGLALAGVRGALPLVFPAVAYADAGAGFRGQAAEILEAASPEVPALRRAYLRKWAIAGDTNFGAVLARHGIDLSEAPAR